MARARSSVKAGAEPAEVWAKTGTPTKSDSTRQTVASADVDLSRRFICGAPFSLTGRCVTPSAAYQFISAAPGPQLYRLTVSGGTEPPLLTKNRHYASNAPPSRLVVLWVVNDSNLRPSVTMESMKCTVAVSLVFLSAVAYSFAQQSDCPAATVINNGVGIDEDGRDCSKREAQSRICFDPEPQYTEKAAKADIKGTVRLTASIDTNGCAKDIMVISPLGHGLDESAVSALQRWRFRKPPRAVRINIEFNFDPKFSSRNAV